LLDGDMSKPLKKPSPSQERKGFAWRLLTGHLQ